MVNLSPLNSCIEFHGWGKSRVLASGHFLNAAMFLSLSSIRRLDGLAHASFLGR